MKKQYNRNFLIDLISVVVTITILIWFYKFDGDDRIRRWANWPRTMITVEGDYSLLLGMLLDQDEFSSSWSWDFVGISQQEILPTISNNFALEIAYKLFHGIYKRTEITLDQTLTRYTTDISDRSSETLPLGTDFNETQVVYVPNLKVATEPQDAKCFLHVDMVECQVVTRYSNVVEKIELTFHSSANKDLIDNALNEILEQKE